jgi:hypothetical protein
MKFEDSTKVTYPNLFSLIFGLQFFFSEVGLKDWKLIWGWEEGVFLFAPFSFRVSNAQIWG